MVKTRDFVLCPDPRPSSRLSPTGVEPSAPFDPNPMVFMSQELSQLVGPIPTVKTQKKKKISD